MKTLGNIIWFLLVGLWTGLAYAISGIILCITIIGIPFGKQCFKIAGLLILPFGKDVDTNFSKHIILNVLWAILIGIWVALVYCFVGIILCITIIGIPFGKQCFKLTQLFFAPFGAIVRD